MEGGASSLPLDILLIVFAYAGPAYIFLGAVCKAWRRAHLRLFGALTSQFFVERRGQCCYLCDHPDVARGVVEQNAVRVVECMRWWHIMPADIDLLAVEMGSLRILGAVIGEIRHKREEVMDAAARSENVRAMVMLRAQGYPLGPIAMAILSEYEMWDVLGWLADSYF